MPSVTSTVGDAQGVVNRDIKLENTLLDQSRRPLIKICDFGYSKHLQKDSVPKSRVGTPGYTGFAHLCASQGSAIQSTLLVCGDLSTLYCTALSVCWLLHCRTLHADSVAVPLHIEHAVCARPEPFCVEQGPALI